MVATVGRKDERDTQRCGGFVEGAQLIAGRRGEQQDGTHTSS
jgi:hypothetical protein